MSASIITFANLGKKKNLKTAGITPVIKTFAEREVLKQVICQVGEDFYFPETYSAVPIWCRYPLRSLDRLLGISSQRAYQKIFDYFAQKDLKRADVHIYHTGQFTPRTFARSKELGAISIKIATTADFRKDRGIEVDEMKILGVDLKREDGVSRGNRQPSEYSFDYVIAYSDFVKTSYVERGFPRERISVAHSDIPLPKITKQKRRNSGTFKVLYVSYTKPRKGLHYLLEAWQKLALPNAELVIVGGYSNSQTSPALRRYYDQIIAADKSIKWVGGVGDVTPYYEDASLFVLPSLSEGNPKVVMEAMAHRLPVITTENAKSIVEDGKSGFVVPVRDAKAIHDKMRLLYDDPSLRDKMGKHAREAIENKPSFGEAVFNIYQEVLKRERMLYPESDKKSHNNDGAQAL